MLQLGEAGPRAGEGARQPPDRAGGAGARARREGHDRDADPQHQPHRRHHALGRDREALRPRGLAGRHHPRALRRLRRAELRRVPRAGRMARPDRRHQRLLRQGPLGRPDQRAALAQVPRRAGREHHHRQRRALRRDRRRGVFPRRRRRALRGAQLGRARGGRGRRRPRLRVHDRRHGGGSGHDRPQFRRRHVGRHRLRARRRRRVREALQHRRWWISSRCCPSPSRRRRSRASVWHLGTADEVAAQAADREPRAVHRQQRARRRSSPTGRSSARSSSRCSRRNTAARWRENAAACARKPSRCMGKARWEGRRDSSSTSGSRSRTRRPRRASKHYREFIAPLSDADAEDPGRALHGLRHAVLHERLPGQQHHPGLQRPRLPGGLETRDRDPALDQQLPRVHRPHLPRALRGGVRAAASTRTRSASSRSSTRSSTRRGEKAG